MSIKIDKEALSSRIDDSLLFSNRFGSFSKSDYEILMFTVYLDSLKREARDYDISIELGITEQKVRNLRVKSQLIYPREIKLVDQITNAVNHGFYDNGMVTVTIENLSVKNLIKNKIEAEYGTVNLSFNSKQLTLPIESFLILAACLERDSKDTLKQLRKVFNEHQKSIGVVEKKSFGKRIINDVPRVNELLSVINSAASIFVVAKPIIESLNKIIPR